MNNCCTILEHRERKRHPIWRTKVHPFRRKIFVHLEILGNILWDFCFYSKYKFVRVISEKLLYRQIKITIPNIRRVFPELVLGDIVGVQPMKTEDIDKMFFALGTKSRFR